jgi:hypothetical protein
VPHVVRSTQPQLPEHVVAAWRVAGAPATRLVLGGQLCGLECATDLVHDSRG